MKFYKKSSPAWLAYSLSNGAFKCPKHISFLERRILKALSKGGGRIIINMPPRHGKSEYISKYLPFWYLSNYPDKRVILTSYEATFAASWGRKVRDLVKKFGKQIFNIEIDESNASVSSFSIKEFGGGMQCAGAGGPITGKGADLLIIDDPVKNDAEANSSTYRDQIWDWFRATAFTRIEPGGTIILVMTRWHEDDLCGRIESELEGWEKICLKAISTGKDSIRSRAGMPLWRNRFSIQELNSIRDSIGEHWFNALYQQEPSSAKGGIFKRNTFQYFNEENDYFTLDDRLVAKQSLRYFAVADLAATNKETSDYTAILVFAISDERNIYIIDNIRARFDSTEHIKLLRNVNAKYNPDLIGVESVQYQISLVNTAVAEGLPVVSLKADKDKVSRALPMAALLESGKVYFNRKLPNLVEFENELLQFPNSRYDDQVDAFAYIKQIIDKYQPSFNPIKKSIKIKKRDQFDF